MKSMYVLHKIDIPKSMIYQSILNPRNVFALEKSIWMLADMNDPIWKISRGGSVILYWCDKVLFTKFISYLTRGTRKEHFP